MVNIAHLWAGTPHRKYLKKCYQLFLRYACTHMHAAWVCVHALCIATLFSVHAPPVSPTHECYRVTNHMNHATRALSMVRAALQWMLLSKILNYQSWKWASGCSFQVSIAAQIGVTIICMYACIHLSCIHVFNIQWLCCIHALLYAAVCKWTNVYTILCPLVHEFVQ